MYKIIKMDGTELGLTDSVQYIKVNENGSYSPAMEKDAFGVAYIDAVGVAYRGVVYNLDGHNEIPDAETVVITEIDAGDVLEQYATYDALAAAYAEGVQDA